MQVNCRRPEWTPWSSTGLYSYRKNPLVWTHCLRNFVHVAGAWSDMRKTSSAVCTFDHEKGVSSYAAGYKCVCLFSATFETSLCRYTLSCELVDAWDHCSKDTVSQSNISRRRRWLWQQEKRRRDKRRQEVERRKTLCASLRASQNEPRTRTTQNADIHVVRACAVATHVNISQKPLENATPQKKSRTQTNTLCEPTQSKRMSKWHNSHFWWKFTGKMPQTKHAPQTWCEPAQSKCMSRFHKSHFIWKFNGKMPQTKLNPERRRTLCASLGSRNACQDFTRATSHRNLQVNCRRPEWAPWSSSYRKNPQCGHTVWGTLYM